MEKVPGGSHEVDGGLLQHVQTYALSFILGSQFFSLLSFVPILRPSIRSSYLSTISNIPSPSSALPLDVATRLSSS